MQEEAPSRGPNIKIKFRGADAPRDTSSGTLGGTSSLIPVMSGLVPAASTATGEPHWQGKVHDQCFMASTRQKKKHGVDASSLVRDEQISDEEMSHAFDGDDDDMLDEDVSSRRDTRAPGSQKKHSRKKKGKAPEDTTWLLTGPAPGGPEIIELIPSFAAHVATDVWNGVEVIFYPFMNCVLVEINYLN